QNDRVAPPELVEYPVVRVAPRRRVKVHPQHTRLGEERRQLLFNALRPHADAHERRRTALTTHLRVALRPSTIVTTDRPSRFVERHRHGAIRTNRRPTAGRTLDRRRIAPPVLQQDDLLVQT